MKTLLYSSPFYCHSAAKRRSPVSLLFVALWLLAGGKADLPAQTISSNFTLGPTDANGFVSVQADWSTVSDGTDRFDTNPGSNPVGDTTDGSTTATYPTPFDMTLGDGANLFASDCSSKYSPGLLNFAGPGSGTHSKLFNYGNLNSYFAEYPSQYPNANQTWGTVHLNYVDFTNCGNVGSLTGKVGYSGTEGTQNSYVVDGSNCTVTNYGTIIGQNTLGTNGVENYGHLVARFGKGIFNRGNAPVNNYTDAGVLSGYNGSYGLDGLGNVNATWNNWGYVSWWTTGIWMITATGTFSDYGGPLVPGTLSNATAANGGTIFAPVSFAPSNQPLAEFDLTYGGTVSCGYNDSDPFESTYAPFNFGAGAAVICGINKNANFYNTVYTVSQAGAVTPAGTKVNFFPVLYGPITSGTTSSTDSTNDPIGTVNLYFDGLSPSEIQDVQYAVAQTSIYTQGILANNANGTPTYVVPRGTTYLNYFAPGTGNVDRAAGALPSGPGHSAYVNIREANYNWLDFLDVSFTHHNDLTADPVPGVFTGTAQSPAYYLNPAGNLPQTTVSANVAGTYVSSGQARDVGSTLSGLSANPGGVSSVGAAVQLNGQTDSMQNGTYVVTALSPGGALLRLNPTLPPAAYTLDDAGATLNGTGNLAASLTPSSPALVQGAFVRVTMQANPVQNGYYTVGALAANSWTLVRSSFFQGNPSTYTTTANLSASYQTPSFTVSGGVASLKGGCNGPILLNAGVVSGDVVLVSGRANPTAGGLYWVQNGGSATTPWVLNRFAAEAGLGALWVTSTNLAGSYVSSGQPGDIGSTLTGSSNGALPTGTDVDVDLGTVILVNSQANAAQNGVYRITALGDGSHPWILQRVQLTQSGTATAASEAAALRSLIYPAATGALQLTVYTETNNVTNVGTDPIQFAAKYSTSLPRQKYNYTSPTTVTLTGNQGLTPGATTNVQAGWTLQLGSQIYGDDTAVTSPTPTGSIVLDSALATASGYNVDGRTNTSRRLTGSLVLENGLINPSAASKIAQQFTPNAFLQTTNPSHQVGTGIPNDTRIYTAPPPAQTPAVTSPVYLPDITGTGDLIQQGSGTTYLTTALTNFSGNLYVSHGRLVLAPSTTLASCGLTMESWDNTGHYSGVLDCSNVSNGQIKPRWLQGTQNPLGNSYPYVPGIALGANKLTIGYGRLSDDPAMVYQGQITGTGGLELLSGVELTLGGSLSSYNTYSGGTVVDAGAILHLSTFPTEADGSSPMVGTGNLTNNGTITLVAGGTQDGSTCQNALINLPTNLQVVGAMGTGGNHLAYVAGNYTQSGNLTLKVNSVGASAGGSFGLAAVSDSLQAVGSITLQSGATLTLNEVNAATVSNAATVILAQGASISGIFSGLPNGARVLVGGNLWTIHYSSTQITLTGSANVAVPALQTPASSNQTASLTWSASTGATSYNVKRATVSGGAYSTVGSTTTNSYSDSGLTNGTTYYYVVTAVRGGAETANSNQVASTPEPGNGTLPEFYQSADIGTVGLAGSSSYSSGTYTLSGSGADIYHTADEFQFASRPVTSDVTLTVRVASQTTTSQDKSGLMIRASSDPSAAFADVTLHRTQAIKMEYRATTGASVTGGENTGITSAPYWLRLVRAGDVFTSFYSPDGVAWTRLRSTTIVMPATVMVGLVQCSHDDTMLSTGTFTNYSVVALPSPWQSADVGTVAAAGSAIDTAGVFNVTGSGADVYGTADAFRYAWQAATGDCDITARVTDVQTSQPYAKAGVMIRETLNANSSQMAVFVTPQQGVEADVRNGTGASTSVTHGAANSAVPYWVRITRAGNTFTAYNSPDGSNWTAVGSPVTIPMSTNTYIGLAVTSHNDGALNTATLDNVTLNP